MTAIAASIITRTMAADTRMNVGDFYFPCKKIVRVGNKLIGAAGTNTETTKFIQYMEDLITDEFTPKPKIKKDADFEALVMDDEGLYYYEHDCIPNKILREFHAIGSGGAPTLAALLCGKTPEQAVKIACEINSQCGLPVTVLKL